MRVKQKDFKSVKDVMTSFKRIKSRYTKLRLVLVSLKKFFTIAGVLDKTITNAAGISLRGGGAVKQSRTTMPKLNMKKLVKEFTLMSELQDYGDELETMTAFLGATKKPTSLSTKALKEVEALYNQVTEDLNSLWDVIKAIASKHESTNMVAMRSLVENGLQTKLEGSYGELTTDFQVAPVDDDIHFVAYYIFEDLVDDDGFKHPQYYIMITEVLSTTNKSNGPEYYVNIANKYLIPGRYRLSTKTTPKNVMSTIGTILSSQKFLDALLNLPVPLDDISLTGKDIKSSEVSKDNESIFVTLKPRKTARTSMDLQKIATDLIVGIKKVLKVSFPRNKHLIRWRLSKTKKDTIEFKLSPPTSKDVTMSRGDYIKIGEILGLSKSQVSLVRKTLEGK